MSFKIDVIKLLWNEDFKNDYIDNENVDLKHFNSVEKEIYKKYQKELNELVKLQRNKKPHERNVFTENEVYLNQFQYRVFKGINFILSNLFKYLTRDPDFGSVILYLILCGINSFNWERLHPSCLVNNCPFPYLDDTILEVNLIEEAIHLHKLILDDLLHSSSNYFNTFSYKCRSSLIHNSSPQESTVLYNKNKIKLHNIFTKIHSKLLEFFPSNSVKKWVYNNVINSCYYNHNSKLYWYFDSNLKNGYHFTSKFSYKRKLAIRTYAKLMKKLSNATNRQQAKIKIHVRDISVVNKFTNGNSKESVNSNEGKEQSEGESAPRTNSGSMNEESEANSNSGTPPIIQSSNFGQNEHDLESEYPLDKEVTSARIGKYDRIVVLGNCHNKYFLEQLKDSKVCITTDNVSIENLVVYIQSKEALVSLNTLWVFITGIEFLFSTITHESCSELSCIHPFQATLPASKISSISKALKTFGELKEYLDSIERNIKRFLNPESDFIFFPPIPPTMIIDSSVTHQDIHKLLSKHPRSYIVTNEMSSYFGNMFEKVSSSIAHVTRAALINMGISVNPLDRYLDSQLYQIDFIDSIFTLPSNKLHYYLKWSNTFKIIVSSCVGDSNCFGTLNDENLLTSTITSSCRSNEERDKSYAGNQTPGSKIRCNYDKFNIVKNCSNIEIQQSVSACISQTPTVVSEVSIHLNKEVIKSNSSEKSGILKHSSDKNKEFQTKKKISSPNPNHSDSLQSLTNDSKSDTKTSTHIFSTSKHSEIKEAFLNKEKKSLLTKVKSNTETSPHNSSAPKHTDINNKASKKSDPAKLRVNSSNGKRYYTSELLDKKAEEKISKKILYNLPSNMRLMKCSIYLEDIMKRKKYVNKYNLYKLSNKKDKYHKSRSSKLSDKEHHSVSKGLKFYSKEKHIHKTSNSSSSETYIASKSLKHSNKNEHHSDNKKCKEYSGSKNAKLSSNLKYYSGGISPKHSSKEKHHSGSKSPKHCTIERHHSGSKSPKHSSKDKYNTNSKSSQFSSSMTSFNKSIKDLCENKNVKKSSLSTSLSPKIPEKTHLEKTKAVNYLEQSPKFITQRTTSFESALDYNYSYFKRKTKNTSKVKGINNSNERNKDDGGVYEKATSTSSTKTKHFPKDSSKSLSSIDKNDKIITSKDKSGTKSLSSPIISKSNLSSGDQSFKSKEMEKCEKHSPIKGKHIKAKDRIKHSHSKGGKVTPAKRPFDKISSSKSSIKKHCEKSIKNPNNLNSEPIERSLNNNAEIESLHKKIKASNNSDDSRLTKKINCLFGESSESLNSDSLATVKKSRKDSYKIFSSCDQSESDSVDIDYQKLMYKHEEDCSLKRESSQEIDNKPFSKGLVKKSQTNIQKPCPLSKKCKKEMKSFVIVNLGSSIKSEVSVLKENASSEEESLSGTIKLEKYSRKTDKDESSSHNSNTDELMDVMQYEETLSTYIKEKIKENIHKAISLYNENDLDNIGDEFTHLLDRNFKRDLASLSEQCNNLNDASNVNKLPEQTKHLLCKALEDSQNKKEASDSVIMSKKSRRDSSQSSNSCDLSSVLAHVSRSEKDSQSYRSSEDYQKLQNQKEWNSRKNESSQETLDNPISKGPAMKSQTRKQKPCPLSKKCKKESGSITSINLEVCCSKETTSDKEENVSHKQLEKSSEKIHDNSLYNTDELSNEMQAYILNCAKEALSAFTNKDIEDEDIPKAVISLCKEHELDEIREDESIFSLDRNLKRFLVFLSIQFHHLPLSYYYDAPYHLLPEEFSQKLNSKIAKLKS